MGLYSKQGLYAGYKKNNNEREALDYYATPPLEVTNILEKLGLNFSYCSILEPCAGGGHMVDGILDYCVKNKCRPNIYMTDIKYREGIWEAVRKKYNTFNSRVIIEDFLSDNYPFNKVDYVIMNPPFSTIEPFVIRGLEIAQKGLLMFGRLQFLEGKSRYNNILEKNPPSNVYVYVDRVKCGKNGDFASTEAIQAYAWFYWEQKVREYENTQLHWIRRK